jgi:hypothetical protein
VPRHRCQGTDEVVAQTRTKHLNNHPVRSHIDASRLFLDVAATPPDQEGQWNTFWPLHAHRREGNYKW